MRRLARVAGWLPLLLTLVLPAFAEGPRLALEESEFRFGAVEQGAKVEHTFRFRNEGDAPLLITRVKSSCGCTAALVADREISPGETGEVKTTFDSGRFMGEVVKTVYLYSNDPRQEVVQFTLRGRVNPELELKPKSLDFGTLVPGSSQEREVTIFNRGQSPIQFPLVQVTSPLLTAEVTPLEVAPGASARLVVTAAPVEAGSRISGYVIVRTANSHVPQLRLPVYALVGESETP